MRRRRRSEPHARLFPGRKRWLSCTAAVFANATALKPAMLVGDQATGRRGRSKSTTSDSPIEFTTNPYSFSRLETTSDSQVHSCTLEVHTTIRRELQ